MYINAIYNLPFGRDQRFMGSANRVVDAVIGGWSTSWVSELMSGQYYTPTYSGFDPSNTNNFGPSTTFVARPDRIRERHSRLRAIDRSVFRCKRIQGARLSRQRSAV